MAAAGRPSSRRWRGDRAAGGRTGRGGGGGRGDGGGGVRGGGGRAGRGGGVQPGCGVADRERGAGARARRRAAGRAASRVAAAAAKWKTEQRRARTSFPKNITYSDQSTASVRNFRAALCKPSEINVLPRGPWKLT
jgi:hypothetical protein